MPLSEKRPQFPPVLRHRQAPLCIPSALWASSVESRGLNVLQAFRGLVGVSGSPWCLGRGGLVRDGGNSGGPMWAFLGIAK